ncbi:MAG: DUF2784 domain-containing protein, partial [Gammaproteobacteria bacterium]
MNNGLQYQLVADGLLILHALFICFVVLGFFVILAGILKKSRWVKNPWLRCAHLAAIGVVVIQAWLGVICPLTTWEMSFREKAGDMTYAGSFIQHWLHRIIFYEAEPWVFTLAYTVFGVA